MPSGKLCNRVAKNIVYLCSVIIKNNKLYDMKKIMRVVVTVVLLIGAMLLTHNVEMPVWQQFLVFLVPYLLIGYDVMAEAAEGVMDGEPFDENFLMFIATMGAMCIGFLPGVEPQFAEAVFVMLFFQIGELFEHYAEHRSRSSISHLMDMRPDAANVERGGSVVSVKPEEVAVGETIVVRPGERVPLDGIVIEGSSSLNTAALTGESMPRDVETGDEVVSGCVNNSGVLRVQVSKNFASSTATRILQLVEDASERKSRSENFISRFARVYTPIVVLLAVVVAFLPPVFYDSYAAAFPTWLERALTFLVVSCPCALVVSIPLTFFAGIGGASRHGILVKGSNYMDLLSEVGAVVFDKTGTLTCGQFEVEAVHPDELSEHQLLHLAAHVERHSLHPIAVSLRDAYPDESDSCTVENVEEVAGQGVRATVNGDVVCVGNSRMMDAIGASWRPCHHVGTIVHVAVNGRYAGHIVVADKVKPQSAEAIQQLRDAGVGRMVMLTGDHDTVAADVAKKLDLDDYHAALLPDGKMQELEKELGSGNGSRVAFVGDGINDAPVLARADVGIAMGALGSDAAIEAADVVLMDDNPTKVAKAISIARHTLGIARQNTVFAIGVKVLVLLLATIGMARMWMAVFADVGVMVLCVINAMRALRSK